MTLFKSCLALLLCCLTSAAFSGDVLNNSASKTKAKKTVPAMEISTLTDGVFLHKSYYQTDDFGLVSSNGLLVVDGKQATIVDTPWSESDTALLLQWAKKRGLNVVASISTHSHDDRTVGIRLLNEKGIATYASVETNQILAEQNKATATHTFPQSEFTLGNNFIEVFYPGGGHTKDNVVVWLPGSQLLLGGCFVRADKDTSLGYVGEAMIKEWPHSAEKLIAKYPNAKIVVPGHGKVGGAELLLHTKKLALEANQN
jgi:glyoxylase-like metal-dependent hydrolase (beta-lactamase superfamily II)